MTSSINSPLTINGRAYGVHLSTTKTTLSAIDSEEGKGSDYILVKTKETINKAQRKELLETGIDSIEFVGNSTYLCHFKPDNISKIQEKPWVIGVTIYGREFKVSSTLSHGLRTDNERKEIKVVLHPVESEPFAETVDKVASTAKVDASSIRIDPTARMLILTVDQSVIPDLTHLDAVRVIDLIVPRQVCNDRARRILGIGNVNPFDPQVPFEYQGDGQVVAVADTGLDKGDMDDMHPAFQGRVKRLVSMWRNDRTDDMHGHGTHVCGSIVGRPAASFPTYANVVGSAPGAQVVMQSLYTSGSPMKVPTGNELVNMFLDPYKNDQAYIHSNSWGSSWTGTQIVYAGDAELVDQCVHDNPDLLIIMAAGNTGFQSESATIGSVAACKNVLTVGATESSRPSENGKASKTKQSDNDPTEISWYSARGPTAEQRFKPDVLAPGTAILSAKSRVLSKFSRTELQDSEDPLYAFCTGTSMATPLVAGCAAIIRQWLVTKMGIAKPPAALLKALLINGAYAFHHAHNGKEGFGIVNVANSLLAPKSDDGGFKMGTPFDDKGQSQVMDCQIPITIGASESKQGANATKDGEDDGPETAIRVTPPAARGITLKVTMVYTDVKGQRLQNNLNLSVRASDGVVRNGNRGSSIMRDNNNNVEQVIWKGIPDGAAQLIVTCNDLTSPQQDYALVWRIIPNQD